MNITQEGEEQAKFRIDLVPPGTMIPILNDSPVPFGWEDVNIPYLNNFKLIIKQKTKKKNEY